MVFLWRFSGCIQLVGDPVVDPEHAGEIIYLIWLGNASGSPRRSWKTLLGRGTSACNHNSSFIFNVQTWEWYWSSHLSLPRMLNYSFNHNNITYMKVSLRVCRDTVRTSKSKIQFSADLLSSLSDHPPSQSTSFTTSAVSKWSEVTSRCGSLVASWNIRDRGLENSITNFWNKHVVEEKKSGPELWTKRSTVQVKLTNSYMTAGQKLKVDSGLFVIYQEKCWKSSDCIFLNGGFGCEICSFSLLSL